MRAAPSRSRSDGSNSTATGKRCDWRSQSRLFSIAGRLPGCDWLPELTPLPTLRTRPFRTWPGITSRTMATSLPGLMLPRLFSVMSALIHRS